MEVKFLSRVDLYKGEYNCAVRNPSCEVDQGAHYHDFYEIQFYFSSVGKLRIGDNYYPIHNRDVALINMFEPHTLVYAPGTEYERFCISVDASFLLGASSEESSVVALFLQQSPASPIYHLDEETFNDIIGILHQYESCRMKQGRDIMQRAYLFMVLAKLYEACNDDRHKQIREAQYIPMLAQLIRFIGEHIAEELPLERLAKEVNFSTYHICRVFKKYTGNTLTQYIISKRIDSAKYMLANTPMPIGEICEANGFNNYSYFYKTFHKMTGMSPADYRVMMELSAG